MVESASGQQSPTVPNILAYHRRIFRHGERGEDPDRTMARIDTITAIAETDSTFRRVGDEWIGKCLICSAPLRFDAQDGGGASVEHIVPRSSGGTDDLLNLGLTHSSCNFEKGTHWDQPKQRRGRQHEYEYLVNRLLTTRRARWRDRDPESID